MKKILLFIYASLTLTVCNAQMQPGMVGALYSNAISGTHWLSLPGYVAISGGGLRFVGSPGHFGFTVANVGHKTGDYYWEVVLTNKDTANGFPIVGLANYVPAASNTVNQLGDVLGTDGYSAASVGCCVQIDITGTIPNGCNGSGCAAQTTGDVISVHVDLTAGKEEYYVDGVFQFSRADLPTGVIYYPAAASDGDASPGSGAANFGTIPYVYKSSICPGCSNW